MKSLALLLKKPKFFPLEISLTSGDKHILPHPDHIELHTQTGDVVIYSDEGERQVDLVIALNEVVSARPIRPAKEPQL